MDAVTKYELREATWTALNDSNLFELNDERCSPTSQDAGARERSLQSGERKWFGAATIEVEIVFFCF
ncbi:hypothetical protein [Methylobacterium iners]|uniref:Transposase n=1 Tax=Methylobacterium iners TaxID=418707 RepID=A0ABQ4RSM4_9HYPH|nr:hypothetical protein [Methylobacterium iners]GJD93199.1 hypothetical protein OCOJLMKI_0390 [Methylobacterium iners]